MFYIGERNGKPWQQVKGKYTYVFRDELGTMKGVEAHIHEPESSTPRYFKPRPLAYSLQGPVVREIERLQEVGSIVPVSHSEWSVPIVPIVKRSGSIRICGDSKITVNQVSKLDNYPMAKTEDLLATIGEGQEFTKLCLSHAYQQLPLDVKSRKYTTISTCKSLFGYTRLPYGISSSLGIFQRVKENLLAYIIVRLDDTLVSGKNDAEHFGNLEEVFKRHSIAGLSKGKQMCFHGSRSSML